MANFLHAIVQIHRQAYRMMMVRIDDDNDDDNDDNYNNHNT